METATNTGMDAATTAYKRVFQKLQKIQEI